jgi:GTP-binding protein Era
MLTKIGSRAREDIEQMTGHKVLLKLFVKVTRDWVDRPGTLNEFGY